jgi:hypothetical protein
MRWRDIPFDPPSKTLRWFALYSFLALLAVAAWQYGAEHEVTALACSAGALVLGSLGVLRPMWLRPLFVASLIVTFPLGWLVSKVLLFVLFFGLFTPLGLVFRLLGRDPLALRFEREYKSYWLDKPAAPDVRSYFRQS